MNNKIWYGLASLASVLLAVLFYLSFKYYQVKTTSPLLNTKITDANSINQQNEKPIVIKGVIFCLNEICNPGLRAENGKEYFLAIRNVEDPQVIETYLDNSSKLEITGTLNSINLETIDNKSYQVITIITHEEI